MSNLYGLKKKTPITFEIVFPPPHFQHKLPLSKKKIQDTVIPYKHTNAHSHTNKSIFQPSLSSAS